MQKTVNAVLGTGLTINDIVPSPLAAAEALLSPQQKELGVAIVDIGAETTSLAVYEEKSLIHLAVLPIGSAHITSDIAIALQTEIDIAENIKKRFGSYIFQNKSKKEKIEIEKGEFFSFDSRKLVRAGKARVEEIFDLIAKELKKVGRQKSLPAGIILTGGGSNLVGIVGFVRQQLSLPVKKGIVKDFIGLPEDPSYSVLCGLAKAGIGQQENGRPMFGRAVFSKIKKLFKVFIP